MQIALFIVIMLFVIPFAYTADWTLRLFETPNGQPFEEVRDIRVEDNGIVWYSSWGNGIARLDGSSWTVFSKENGLLSNYVPAIELDGGGGVWAATDKGINYILPNGVIETFTPAEIPILDEPSLNDVYRLSSGEIWFGSDSGSITGCCALSSNSSYVDSQSGYEYGGYKWFAVKAPVNVNGDSIYQILEAHDSTIWAAQDSLGLFFLKDRQWVHEEDPLIIGRIRSLSQDQKGRIWSTSGNVIYFENQQWHQDVNQNGLYIASTPDGTLFFTDEENVWVRKYQTWEPIPFPKHFGKPKTRVIYFGSNHHGWIGTKEGLIEVVHNHFVRKDQLSSPSLRIGCDFYASPTEAPITIDERFQLVRYQDEQWVPLLQFPIETSEQNSLSKTVQNKIWAKLDQQVYEISLQQNEILHTFPLPEHLQFQDIFLSVNGVPYVYGESGIYQLSSGNWNPFANTDGAAVPVIGVRETEDGILILCKKESVEWWNGGTMINEWNPGQILPKEHFDLHPFTFASISRDGRLWVGTRGMGVMSQHNNSFHNLTTQEGLISNRIVNFYEDTNSVYWIGSENKGVSSFAHNRWIHYSHDEGIDSSEMNGIFEYPKGCIWITTVANYIYFYEPTTHPPDTVMNRFPGSIPHDGFGIFTYDGYDFWNRTPRNQLVYSWRIVNNKTEKDAVSWSLYDSDTSAQSPPLFPGEYRFEVKSSGKDRAEDLTPASALFAVLPPPVTARSWFIPLVTTVVLCTLFLAITAYFSRLQVAVYAANLETLVNKRTEELSKANQTLVNEIEERKQIEMQLLQSQKMEAIGKLSGGIAHDFNNILTGLMGYSDILLVHLKLNDPNRTYVDAIKKSCKRAADLINQLLAFSRKQILQPKVLQVNCQIIETKSMLERLMGENVHLSLDLEDSIRLIEMDPGQLEQVLLNLTVNAHDAMPSGGTIVFRTKNIQLNYPKQLSTAMIPPGSYVVLTVQDTGTGMSHDVMQHIFEPFYTTKGVKGSGLGLSTTYGIIQQSNAFIEVESQEQKGSTFTIYFPASSKALAVEEIKNEPVSSIACKTILLVDDEEVIVKLLNQTLQKDGYTTFTADSAESAYKVFKAMDTKLDLLITDVVMPGLSGKDLAELINKEYPVKTIFMSGYTNDVIGKHGVLEGDVSFIQKPFEMQELVRKIQMVFS